MSKLTIGTVVYIPLLQEGGVICGYKESNNSYAIELEGMWVEDVALSDMELMSPGPAKPSHDSFQSYQSS